MTLDSRRIDDFNLVLFRSIPATSPDLLQIWPPCLRQPGRLGSGMLAAITPESVAGLLRRAQRSGVASAPSQ